jgi:signal transduction histidine kinase
MEINMASRPTESVPIVGRVDGQGRLISADPAFERLQLEAGSGLGQLLALPQLAALARAAASLGVTLSRNVVAADRQHDLDLFVRAEPIKDEVLLTIERWAARPITPPRLALVETIDIDDRTVRPSIEFDVDAALNLVDCSPALAGLLGVEALEAVGRPLTSLFRLIEESDGSMPILAAVAARRPVDCQRAVPRHDGGVEILIDADPSFDEHGDFAGFNARIRNAGDEAPDYDPPVFEDSLDEALRSPLARIISAADHIVDRGDGPLRSDYANYACDIAAAGRHLLSVIRSIGQGGTPSQQIDLAQVISEAVALVHPVAAERGITINGGHVDAKCRAKGQSHAVVQILVNLFGNAVRFSPDGASVTWSFEHDARECRLIVTDKGPGIAPSDQQRIFERYERVDENIDGSGLGLAISRRLARTMGGDIRLESVPGEGARFTLVLPVT